MQHVINLEKSCGMGNKVERAIHKYKRGTLHSGSKKGPKVKKRKQAIAIGMSEERAKGKKTRKALVNGKLTLISTPDEMLEKAHFILEPDTTDKEKINKAIDGAVLEVFGEKFLKAHVKSHMSHSKSGKIFNVKDYMNKKKEEGERVPASQLKPGHIVHAGGSIIEITHVEKHPDKKDTHTVQYKVHASDKSGKLEKLDEPVQKVAHVSSKMNFMVHGHHGSEEHAKSEGKGKLHDRISSLAKKIDKYVSEHTDTYNPRFHKPETDRFYGDKAKLEKMRNRLAALKKSGGETIQKAHVKAHTRKTKSGTLSQVKEYEDKRNASAEKRKRSELQKEIAILKKRLDEKVGLFNKQYKDAYSLNEQEGKDKEAEELHNLAEKNEERANLLEEELLKKKKEFSELKERNMSLGHHTRKMAMRRAKTWYKMHWQDQTEDTAVAHMMKKYGLDRSDAKQVYGQVEDAAIKKNKKSK